LQDALAAGNANVGGGQDRGPAALVVRGLGQLGGGQDPMQSTKVLSARDPAAAAAFLRSEEKRRLREIRRIVLATINNVPVRVEDVVEGGPVGGEDPGTQGVVVGHAPRRSQVGLSLPRAERGRSGQVVWADEDEVVQGAVLLRTGEDARVAWRDVAAKIRQLNDTPGRLLPGVRIEPYDPPAADGAGAGPVPDERRIWVRGSFPVDASLEAVAANVRQVRAALRGEGEVQGVLSRIGRPEDGTNTTGARDIQLLVLLRPMRDWPVPAGRDRPRSQEELLEAFRAGLQRSSAGVDWCFAGPDPWDPRVSSASRGMVLVKIFGPDLDELGRLAKRTRQRLAKVEGITDVCVLHGGEEAHLELRVDREKCARWGVAVADVNRLIEAAVSGRAVTQMIEGEKMYDITLRWPDRLRRGETALLDLPVDVTANVVTPGAPGPGPLPTTGPGGKAPPVQGMPRLRLRDLVTPVGADGRPDPEKEFVRRSPSVICREQGRRLTALSFTVRGRGTAAAVTEARRAVAPLLPAGYRAEWEDPR
jgi:hypothetical protein